MTTDEMVQEIRALYEAMHASPDVISEMISETRIECGREGASARHGSYSAHAKTCAVALDGLRGKLRAAAEKALAEHEAKAETLRKALGVPSPAMADDDLRATVRKYFAAERAFDDAKCRGLVNLVFDADQTMRRAREAMLTALGSHGPKSPPADAMGGAL